VGSDEALDYGKINGTNFSDGYQISCEFDRSF
jgi:hypothetical protein